MTMMAAELTKSVETVCGYCGVGCGLTLTAAQESDGWCVTKSTGTKRHPANAGRLCTKGGATSDLLNAGGRQTRAIIDGRPRAVDEAAAEAARRFSAIRDEHGDDSVAFYVSGQMSLESQYLANKLAKGYFRTNQIESNSRLCMASASTGYKQSLGADGPPGSYDDIDQADAFLVIGSNMSDCHPVLFMRMMDRVKAGAKLIVVDPRRTATAKKADLYLPIRPGTDMALLNGLLRLIVDAGLVDTDFINEFTEGWAVTVDHLADYPAETVAEITGLNEQDVRQAAEWIGSTDKFVSLWTMGLNQSIHGTWHTTALCNLHLATGAICKPGAGPFSLTGQPNAMGGREMGYMGPGLPGQRSVLSPADRNHVEKAWGIPSGTLHDNLGGGTVDMFDALAKGKIRAVWIICTNPVASMANNSRVIKALEQADLVVVQDAFSGTATANFADIVLPAALWSESEGVMVNSERNLTLTIPLLDAPGEAAPDWELICRVAKHMGFAGFDFANAAEVFEEIRQFHNPRTGWDIRGIDYDRLRKSPVQWPAADTSGSPRNPIRYLNDGASQHLHIDDNGNTPRLAFPTPSRKAQFLAHPYLPPHEVPDKDYPLVLTTGRLPHQWHTMTKTSLVPKLMKLNPESFVQIHPKDANEYNIAAGDLVDVSSRRGSVKVPALISDEIVQGTCFIPMHFPYQAVNAVTSDAVDPESLQPEFKACAVSLSLVSQEVVSTDILDDLFKSPLAQEYFQELDANSRHYLEGMLFSLRMSPPEREVPVIPPNAPLPPKTEAWVNGLLAGLYNRIPTATDVAAFPSTAQETDPSLTPTHPAVTVVWASQTGTVEEYVPTVLSTLYSAGLAACDVCAEDFDIESANGPVLFIVASTGDGESPDNGESLWNALVARTEPLPSLAYAVLGFGDSSYADFCGFARKLNEKLTTLGATALTDLVCCEPDFEDQASQWLESAMDALPDTRPSAATPSTEKDSSEFSRSNPCNTTLLESTELTGDGSSKEVRRVSFELPDQGLSYTTGDALGVWPQNNPEVVAEWLSLTGLDPDAPVTIKGETFTLEQAAITKLDITSISPKTLRLFDHHYPDAGFGEATKNPDRLRELSWGQHLCDLLATHPIQVDVDKWVDYLPQLKPRMYSISSSPHTNPLKVEITVSTVAFNTKGHIRRGVCSGFLADAKTGDTVKVFISPNKKFRPPEDTSVPMIMVGPGTGVAPFRGFLHDRRHVGAKGESWLFFGDRCQETDYLYRDDLREMHDNGVLTRLDTAFSRDQPEKVYVQDLMRKKGKELWSWIDRGAYIFVCGDASRMAADVDDTLHHIVAEHGGMEASEAHKFITTLKTERRYVQDVY